MLYLRIDVAPGRIDAWSPEASNAAEFVPGDNLIGQEMGCRRAGREWLPQLAEGRILDLCAARASLTQAPQVTKVQNKIRFDTDLHRNFSKDKLGSDWLGSHSWIQIGPKFDGTQARPMPPQSGRRSPE